MDSSSTGEANIIQQLCNIDFDAPIKVDVIFEDSDDEQESSEIKQENLMVSQPPENKRFSPNSETHTTVVENHYLSQPRIVNSSEDKENRKRKSENEEISVSKVFKKENFVKIEGMIKEEKNETECVNTTSCQTSAALPKNNEEINDSNNTHITAYVSNLLKAVSRHLILILSSYYKYRDNRQNKDLAEKLYQDFLRVRGHFFNLSFCTVANIILPEINNRMFIAKFLTDTASLAAEKNLRLDVKTQVGPIFAELVNWTRRKNADTDEIDARTEPINVNNVQPDSENSALLQRLQQPPMLKNGNNNGNMHMLVNNTNTDVSFRNEAKSVDAISSKSVLFESGPPEQRISISLDSSLTCSVNDTTNVTPNITQNQRHIPQLYQRQSVQEQPILQMLHQEISNSIAQVDQRLTYLQQQQTILKQQTTPRDYNYSKNLPPPYPANNPSNYPADQRQYSISSQYAQPNLQQENYQKQISQNAIMRNAQSSKNKKCTDLPNRYPANNSSHLMADQLQSSSSSQQYFQQEHYQKQMSQYLLARNVQYSGHLPPYSEKSISHAAINPNTSQCQWQNDQQQCYSKQISRSFASRPSKTETTNKNNQQKCSQMVPSEYMQIQNAVTQLQENKKTPVTPIHTFSFQTEFSSFLRPDEPHSQSKGMHATGAQIIQPLQVEPSNAEISRSESTDSGFMSPLNFYTNETNKDQTEDERACTPVITHITSLNPAASYIDEGNCCVCRKVTRKMCLGCYKKYYCSADCQRVDWNSHMVICTQLQKTTTP